jgi:hypothetical protein
MSEETNNRTLRFNQVLERFSKLNVGGMHYFIGRLIGSGMEKPVLKTEIERAMQRLETDSHLRKGWKAADSAEEQAPAISEAAP